MPCLSIPVLVSVDVLADVAYRRILSPLVHGLN